MNFEGIFNKRSKKKEHYPVNQELLDRDNKRSGLSMSDGFEDLDGENSQIEEINLPNLTVHDLQKLQAAQILKENILTGSYQQNLDFAEKVEEFMIRIQDAYDEEELESCALYHVLIDDEIPEGADRVDFDGEYSIEDFLREIQTQTNSESGEIEVPKEDN
jgi:hypothetical protein